MKTRGIKDLYLPKSISIHVKILLFCAIITPLWGLFAKVEFNSIFLIGTFLMALADIEIILFISNRISKFKIDGNQKEVTRNNLFGWDY